MIFPWWELIPSYLSLSLIIEEGFPVEDLKRDCLLHP